MVQAVTGDDGTFRIDGLDPGPWTLVVGRLPGPVHRVPALRPGPASVEVRLPPGGGSAADPYPTRASAPAAGRTPAGPILAGRVVGPGGRPEPCGFVHAFRASGTPGAGASFTADAEGRFEGPGPEGGHVSLWAEDLRGARTYLDGVAPGARDLVLRFPTSGSGTLRGRVVTAAGAAAAGVPVSAVRLDPEGGSPTEVRCRPDDRAPSAGTFDPGLFRRTLTGPDGRFDLGSPPGRWAVFAGAAGSGRPALGPSQEWTAAATAPLELSTGRDLALRVRALDPDAPPGADRVAFARVLLEGFLPAPAPSVAVLALPGEDGVFDLRGLPPGNFPVELTTSAGRILASATLRPGEPGDGPAEVKVVR
jgi:hypothetical protein